MGEDSANKYALIVVDLTRGRVTVVVMVTIWPRHPTLGSNRSSAVANAYP